MEFGDYVKIKQSSGEMYLHKVIGTLKSNTYVDVPVKLPRTETWHNKIIDVVSCICCGIQEREAFYYNIDEVESLEKDDGL